MIYIALSGKFTSCVKYPDISVDEKVLQHGSFIIP